MPAARKKIVPAIAVGIDAVHENNHFTLIRVKEKITAGKVGWTPAVGIEKKAAFKMPPLYQAWAALTRRASAVARFMKAGRRSVTLAYSCSYCFLMGAGVGVLK